VPTPEQARNVRRAAELFHAWERDDTNALLALVEEAEDAGESLFNVVFGLLYVGSNVAKAAADGKHSHYLEQLRGASMLAELETENQP
jgi:hypothetical protein